MKMYFPSNLRLTVPRIATLFCLLLIQTGTALAVSVGPIDNFSDGTLQAWKMGLDSVTAANMAIVDGGPAGAGDNYLQVLSNASFVRGNRLTFYNQLQWTGDYTTAGIGSIAMDVNNIDSTGPLDLRLAIDGGGGLFATTASVTLDSGSGWAHVVFSFVASDFTAVSGNSGTTGFDITATLANVTELRLLNSALPDWTGPKVTATLGIDNITAISAVPLPPALLLYGSGLIILGAWRSRRR